MEDEKLKKLKETKNKRKSSENKEDRKKRIEFKQKNQVDQLKSILKNPSNLKYKLGFKDGGLIKKGKPKIATKGWK